MSAPEHDATQLAAEITALPKALLRTMKHVDLQRRGFTDQIEEPTSLHHILAWPPPFEGGNPLWHHDAVNKTQQILQTCLGLRHPA